MIQFGSPFKGYVSSVPRHQVPNDSITADSRDCVMDPSSGAVVRRGGSQIVGDTAVAGVEQAGLLEGAWSARARRLFPMRSESLTDGYETYAGLFTRETQPSSGTFPTSDEGFFGTIYARNTNSGATLANYSLLSEFGATHYQTSAGTYTGAHNIVCVPLWYESGAGGYTRGAFKFARRFLCAGSRSVIDSTDKLLWGGLRSTPGWWNKRMNNATDSGSQVNRVFPAGPYPVAAAPVAGSPTAVGGAGNDAVWADGDTYAIAVLGRKKDGSYTMPTLPRLPNTNNTAGLGIVVVGTPGGTTKYAAMTYAIPIFPDDIEARVICRTKKSTRAAATDALGIDIGTLYICGVIRNNTQLTFTDTNGNDIGLLADTNIVRLDHVQPRRSRYLGTGDQRALSGYTLPGQAALIIAPMGAATNWSTSSQGLNAPDTSSIMYGAINLIRITTAELQIGRWDTAGGAFYSGAPAAVTLSGKTLQDVADLINATAASGNDEGQWRCQIAPGVDPTTDATTLCPTTWDVASVSGTSGNSYLTANAAGDFDNIPLGYRIYGSANLPANATVIRKDSTVTPNRLYIGDANGTAATLSGNIAAATLTFWAQCGDENDAVSGAGRWHATNRGYIRVFGAAYYFMAYLKRSTLAGYDTPDRHSTYFTISSPGAAVSGVSLAPEAWVAGNKRFAPASLGIHQGFVDIEGAAVVGFAKGLRMFINVRGASTGEDFDYRMMNVEDAGGVTDDKAFVGGRGWATYANDEGVFAIDKERQPKKLSEAIHNYDTGTGNLSYELAECRKAVEADTDTNHFHASVIGAQLHIAYRDSSSGSPTWPTRRQVYHFSPGVEAAGLQELVDPETRQPYGWSAPITQRLSCMTQVTTSSGRLRIGTVESNAGTANGRIDRFDMSSVTTDNGTAYSPKFYSATIFPPWFNRFSLKRAEFIHYSPSGSGSVLQVYRLKDRSDWSSLTTTDSSADPSRDIFEFPTSLRSNGDACEALWTFGAVDGAKAYGLVVDADLAEYFGSAAGAIGGAATPPDTIYLSEGEDIQPAVNSLTNGGRIFLGEGTFYGDSASPSTPITVGDSILIEGVSRDLTIVKSPFLFQVSHCQLSQLWVRPSGTAYGVKVYNGGSPFISRCAMRDVQVGASSAGAGDGPVLGLQLDGAGVVLAERCIFAFCTSHGLLVDSTGVEPNTALKFDVCSFVGNGGYGVDIAASCVIAEFSGGNMEENTSGELRATSMNHLRLMGVYFEPEAAYTNAVEATNCNPVEIVGCYFLKISGATRAIFIQSGSGHIVDGNRFSGWGETGIVRVSEGAKNARVSQNHIVEGSGWIEDYSRQ